MRFLKWLLVIVFIGIIIWAFLPKNTFGGEPKYNIEVGARINQQKIIGWIPGIDEYTVDNVKYEVTGLSKNIEFYDAFFIAEFGDVEFCIDEKCQWNSEIFLISPGEQRTTTETITDISSGSHNLTIKFYVNENLKAIHSEMITV
jgi:hypothetical protein